MSVFTIKKSDQAAWDAVKKMAYDVANDLEGKRYADEKINTLFFGTEVRSDQLAALFDRDSNGKVQLAEFDDPKGVCPFVVYDYDEEGRDSQYEYSCIAQPQQRFQSFAKFFTDHGDSILNYISNLDGFALKTHEPSTIDSNDTGSNAPLLLHGYEEFMKRVPKAEAQAKPAEPQIDLE